MFRKREDDIQDFINPFKLVNCKWEELWEKKEKEYMSLGRF